MNQLKQKLYSHCMTFLTDRISAIDAIMEECQQAANSETKTTAGDKHETNRALMQLDRENHAVQRVTALQSLTQLKRIDLSQEHEEAVLGSVIRTDRGNFFLAISVGKVVVDGLMFHVVSPESPIGQAFLGAEEEDEIFFRNRKYEVTAVF